MRTILLAIAMILSFAISTMAENITLNNGKILEGTVLARKSDHLVIKLEELNVQINIKLTNIKPSDTRSSDSLISEYGDQLLRMGDLPGAVARYKKVAHGNTTDTLKLVHAQCLWKLKLIKNLNGISIDEQERQIHEIINNCKPEVKDVPRSILRNIFLERARRAEDFFDHQTSYLYLTKVLSLPSLNDNINIYYTSLNNDDIKDMISDSEGNPENQERIRKSGQDYFKNVFLPQLKNRHKIARDKAKERRLLAEKQRKHAIDARAEARFKERAFNDSYFSMGASPVNGNGSSSLPCPYCKGSGMDGNSPAMEALTQESIMTGGYTESTVPLCPHCHGRKHL